MTKIHITHPLPIKNLSIQIFLRRIILIIFIIIKIILKMFPRIKKSNFLFRKFFNRPKIVIQEKIVKSKT